MANSYRVTVVTYQSLTGSTIVGRIVPLLAELPANYDIQLYVLDQTQTTELPSTIHPYTVGPEPFIRTPQGKQRYGGFKLVWTMLTTALHIAQRLWHDQPDLVIMVKPLPAVVLGTWLWRLWHPRPKVVLDVDDFELTANVLSSLLQRAAIHWSERVGARLATIITAATPFLVDHFSQLTQQTKPVELLPTGVFTPPAIASTPSTEPGPTLLYIGSVSVASGHRVDLLPDILQAVRQTIPKARLIMAGTGDDVELIKKRLAALGLTEAVEYTGRFNRTDLPNLLAQSSVIIDPIDDSLANRAKSSFRSSLAAVTGWPIVTSNIGIRPYWLPDQLQPKFFAKPGDISDYTEKIVHLLQQPLTSVERHSMQTHANQYIWPTLAQRFLHFLTT